MNLEDALEVERAEDFEGEDDLVLVALVGRGEGVGAVPVVALRSSCLDERLVGEDLGDEVEDAFCSGEERKVSGGEDDSRRRTGAPWISGRRGGMSLPSWVKACSRAGLSPYANMRSSNSCMCLVRA